MADFDPDAYLKSKVAPVPAFDPDAYLNAKAAPREATLEEAAQILGGIQQAKEILAASPAVGIYQGGLRADAADKARIDKMSGPQMADALQKTNAVDSGKALDLTVPDGRRESDVARSRLEQSKAYNPALQNVVNAGVQQSEEGLVSPGAVHGLINTATLGSLAASQNAMNGTSAGKFVDAARTGLEQVASGLTSPQNIAMAAGAELALPAKAMPLIAAAFAVQAAPGTYDSIKQAVKTGTAEDYGTATAQVLALAGMAAGAAHSFREVPTPVLETALKDPAIAEHATGKQMADELHARALEQASPTGSIPAEAIRQQPPPVPAEPVSTPKEVTPSESQTIQTDAQKTEGQVAEAQPDVPPVEAAPVGQSNLTAPVEKNVNDFLMLASGDHAKAAEMARQYADQTRKSATTLWRAGKDSEVGVKPWSSWTTDKETAQAYLDNPGFGGDTLRSEDVLLKNTLEADTTTERGMKKLALDIGLTDEQGEEWWGNNWRYPWEESLKVSKAIEKAGFDSIKYIDDFPEGAKTVAPIKVVSMQEVAKNLEAVADELDRRGKAAEPVSDFGIKSKTPLMQRYADIKRSAPPETVVLMRMGDFYEVFGDDASKVSKALNVALTNRAGTPMSGIPIHAADAYLRKLSDAGIKTLISDASESLKPAEPVTKPATPTKTETHAQARQRARMGTLEQREQGAGVPLDPKETAELAKLRGKFGAEAPKPLDWTTVETAARELAAKNTTTGTVLIEDLADKLGVHPDQVKSAIQQQRTAKGGIELIRGEPLELPSVQKLPKDAQGYIDQGTREAAVKRAGIQEGGDNYLRFRLLDEGIDVPPEHITPGAMRTGELPQQGTTALNKATVKDERLRRGLDDLPPEERQSEEARVQKAEEAVDSNPHAADRLVSRIVDSGTRSITADEAATLLVERNRVMNERRALEAEHADPETTEARKSEIDKALQGIEEKTERLDKAQRYAGSEWGRIGRMYQRLIREDYTLEALQNRMRRAKNGPLTETDRASIKEISDNVADLTKQFEQAKNLQSELEQQAEVIRVHGETIKELQAQAAAAPKFGKDVLDIARGIVDRWKTEAESARVSLRKRLGQTNIGADPTQAVGVISDLAKIMRAHAGELGLDFAKSSAKLLEEFGEVVRPYLKKAWVKAQDAITKEKAGPKVKQAIKEGAGKVKSEKKPLDVQARLHAEATAGEELSHKTVYDLARAHINAGVHGEDAVMKAVHKDVKESYPKATERDVRRAFSEYGKAKFPSKEADKVELAELRTLTRLQESIDRLTEGRDAMKTGLQRDKATQAIREKQKQLNELLKKRQGPPSPEKLATNMEARKTALRNQIADLDKQLQTGDKPPAGSPPPPLDAEGERLTAIRDAMKAKLKEIEDADHPPKTDAEKQVEQLSKVKAKLDEIMSGEREPDKSKPFTALSEAAQDIHDEIQYMRAWLDRWRRDELPKTDPNAARERAQINAIESAIKRYEEKTSNGDFAPEDKGAPRPDTEKVAAARAILEARKAVYDAAKKASRPVVTPEERYNATRQKAITKQIEEVKERIRTNNYTKTAKPPTPAKNPETVRLWTELQKEKERARQLEEKLRLENRSGPQKAVDFVKSIGHLVTAAKIIGHGTVGMVTHAGGLLWRPTQAIPYWRNFGRQFGMWVNPAYHERLIYNLENHPQFNAWRDAGLSIDPYRTYTDFGMYAKWLGKLKAGGNRGFDALKLARLELAESAWKGVSDEIKANPQDALETRKAIADMTNKATGAIDKSNNWLNQAARNPAANVMFFAPKLYASRFARVVLDPVKTADTYLNWSKASAAERYAANTKVKHAAEFAATYVGAMLVNQAILNATGSSQKLNLTDPTKRDWLKFKAGGKEIVAEGGLLDPVRLLGQIVWGDLYKNRTSNERYRQGTRYQKVTADLGDYIRGKFNPTLGLVVDATTGTDFTGRPLPWSKEPPKYKDQPRYKWGEWLLSQGPIPLSGGTRVAYDEMRKKGLSHVQAMNLLQGAAVSVAGMTGAHVTEDHTSK